MKINSHFEVLNSDEISESLLISDIVWGYRLPRDLLWPSYTVLSHSQWVNDLRPMKGNVSFYKKSVNDVIERGNRSCIKFRVQVSPFDTRISSFESFIYWDGLMLKWSPHTTIVNSLYDSSSEKYYFPICGLFLTKEEAQTARMYYCSNHKFFVYIRDWETHIESLTTGKILKCGQLTNDISDRDPGKWIIISSPGSNQPFLVSHGPKDGVSKVQFFTNNATIHTLHGSESTLLLSTQDSKKAFVVANEVSPVEEDTNILPFKGYK